jgi:hypothetical protein
MRHKPSSRKPALKGGWKLPYLERHLRRLAVANRPGCRKFLQEFAASERLELEILDGGRTWLFRRQGRLFASWKPYSAALRFKSQRDTFHCHDCFQAKHEIQLRLHGPKSKTA